MKTYKTLLAILFILILFLMSACYRVYPTTTVVKDNGKHKGWYKNTNNPHHPNSTNPGKGNAKHKKKK